MQGTVLGLSFRAPVPCLTVLCASANTPEWGPGIIKLTRFRSVFDSVTLRLREEEFLFWAHALKQLVSTR